MAPDVGLELLIEVLRSFLVFLVKILDLLLKSLRGGIQFAFRLASDGFSDDAADRLPDAGGFPVLAVHHVMVELVADDEIDASRVVRVDVRRAFPALLVVAVPAANGFVPGCLLAVRLKFFGPFGLLCLQLLRREPDDVHSGHRGDLLGHPAASVACRNAFGFRVACLRFAFGLYGDGVLRDGFAFLHVAGFALSAVAAVGCAFHEGREHLFASAHEEACPCPAHEILADFVPGGKLQLVRAHGLDERIPEGLRDFLGSFREIAHDGFLADFLHGYAHHGGHGFLRRVLRQLLDGRLRDAFKTGLAKFADGLADGFLGDGRADDLDQFGGRLASAQKGHRLVLADFLDKVLDGGADGFLPRAFAE